MIMLSLKNFYHIKMPPWITTNFNPMYRTYIPEQLLMHDSTFNPVDINLDSSLPYSSVSQPGFRGTLGFRETLLRVPQEIGEFQKFEAFFIF